MPQVEFIIMGGTFMSMPEDYRNKFIAQLHNALSGFTGFDVDEAVRYVSSVHMLLAPKNRASSIILRYSDIPNRANLKPSASPLKHGQITV